MAGKNRMLIDYTPGEDCRVAVTTDGMLEEFHSERAGAISIVGNIYVGRVANVERAIQAAFVDFGTGTNGFLHVSDLHPQYFPGGDDETTEKVGQKTPRRSRPPIERCLKRGQKILVQVLKENISTKGPTLTSYLSIPGRYLVMLPDMDKVGVSRKVEDDDARRSMRKVLDTLDLPEEFGFILRTAGVGKTKTDLKRDLAYLQRLWKDIDARLKKGDKPRLLYAESDLLMRALRDIWTADIDEIVINDESALRRAHAFMRIVSPRSKTQLLRYDKPVPLFHAFGAEEQVEGIHAREVPLVSGGSLVIDEAEAMVAIDVNSGKSRSHGDAETTAFKTNQEAVDAICRQIKLREVGGLIMLDLIDMSKRSHRKAIEQQIEERLKLDRASTKALPISQFGIVEMTRQRVRDSHRNQHFTRQTVGDVRGWVRKPESVAESAVRQLSALLSYDKVHSVEMVVAPKVAGAMLSGQRTVLSRLEVKLRKRVMVRVSETIAADRVTFYAYDENGADVNIEKLPKFRVPRSLAEYAPPAKRRSDADGDDASWSVDSTAEHKPDLEDIVIEEQDRLDEVLSLEAELDEIEAEEAAAENEEDGEEEGARGGRRRRRRRGRRRGRGAAEGEDEYTDDPADDAESPAASGGEDRDAPEGGGKKRRRRRRRRRGGAGDDERSELRASDDRSEDGADDSPDGAVEEGTGSTAIEHDPATRDALKRRARALTDAFGPTAPSGFPWRGDSWDIEPSALTAASNGSFKDPADAELAERLRAGEDIASIEVEGRSGDAGRGRRRASDRDERDGELTESAQAEAGGRSGDDEAGGAPASADGDGKKRRRRRRGGRGRRRDEDVTEADGGGDGSSPGGSPVRRETRRASPAEAPPASQPKSAAAVEAEVKPSTRRVNTRTRKKVAPKDVLGTGVVPARSADKPARKPVATATRAVTKKTSTKKASSKKVVSKKAVSKKAASKKATSKKKVTKKSATKKATSKKRVSKKKAGTRAGA